MPTMELKRSASEKIMSVPTFQNKIVERLKNQVQCNSASEPVNAYSRNHTRHNRSHTRS